MRVVRTPSSPATELGRAKVCLLGEREAGKTAFASRVSLGRTPEEYRPTFGARGYRRRLGLNLGGTRYLVQVDLWDAPGHAALFSLLERALLHDADGVLFVADGSRRDALKTLLPWLQTARHHAPTAIRMLLLNKADQRPGVHRAAVTDLARRHRLPWTFVSAREGVNTDGAMVNLVAWILERHLARCPRPAPAPLL